MSAAEKVKELHGHEPRCSSCFCLLIWHISDILSDIVTFFSLSHSVSHSFWHIFLALYLTYFFAALMSFTFQTPFTNFESTDFCHLQRRSNLLICLFAIFGLNDYVVLFCFNSITSNCGSWYIKVSFQECLEIQGGFAKLENSHSWWGSAKLFRHMLAGSVLVEIDWWASRSSLLIVWRRSDSLGLKRWVPNGSCLDSHNVRPLWSGRINVLRLPSIYLAALVVGALEVSQMRWSQLNVIL